MTNTGLTIAVVVLWIVVIADTYAILSLLRRRAQAMDSIRNPGLKPGDPVPPLDVSTVSGKRVTSEMLRARGGVVVFASAGCAPCQDAMPQYGELGRLADGADVPFVVVADADDEQVAKLVNEFDIAHCLSPKLGCMRTYRDTWHVRGTPHFARIANGLVMSSGLTNAGYAEWRDAIKWIRRAATNPTPSAGVMSS